MPRKPPPCEICDCPGNGCYYRIYCCRPCASFFRRSILDRRQYVCRLQGKCPINEEGMRVSCKACRLKRCLEAGMRPDLVTNSKTNDPANEASAAQTVSSTSAIVSSSSYPITTSSISNSAAQIATLHFDLDVPLSQQLAKSLKEFEDGSRAVVAQYFGLNVAYGASVRLITNSEAVQLERACAPLFVAFMRNHFPEFDDLDNSIKANLMKTFMGIFRALTSIDWTMRTFRYQSDITQYVHFLGCMADQKNHCAEFFSSVTGVGKQQQIDLCITHFDRWLNFMNNMYGPLRVTALEKAALAGIMLWNSINEFTDNKFAQQRDALYGELNALAIQNALSHIDQQQAIAVPTRFGQLLNLIREITNLNKDLEELFSLSKVFLDANSSMEYNNFWDDLFLI